MSDYSFSEVFEQKAVYVNLGGGMYRLDEIIGVVPDDEHPNCSMLMLKSGSQIRIDISVKTAVRALKRKKRGRLEV